MKFIGLLKRLKNSKWSLLIAPFYILLVFLELRIEHLLDTLYFRKHKIDHSIALDEVTALIKTFERPIKLKRLVNSIRRFYPELKIMVVDDSKKITNIEGVETITLPYDSGVSAGRNAGINAVKTKYILLLDDDFIFTRHTNICQAYLNIKNNPSIDILAGEVQNLPFKIAHDYSKDLVFLHNIKPVHKPGSCIGGFKVLLKTPNFYIGNTEKIKQVAWDNQLKRLDHADFFIRAIGILTCVQDKSFKILHDPTYFKRAYTKHRHDLYNDRVILRNKYN